MNCPTCHIELSYDHTDYYDFDIYICPKCGHQLAMSVDGYFDDDTLIDLYGDDYFEDDDYYGEE